MVLAKKFKCGYIKEVFKAILILVILAFIVRILFIFQGGVSFHYDMARDAFEAREIWQDYNLKIQGPPTSTPGLFHGVFYYYLIAPFYLLGQGDPRVVAIFLSLLNSLVIIPIVILARNLFKSKKWAILSGFLFVVSFEATQYSPWISNPAPAVLTIALFFLGLYWWYKEKTYGLYLAVLSAVLSAQFQFFLIYLLLLIPLFGIIFRIKTSIKAIILSVIIVLSGFLTFIAAVIKFHTITQILKGFLNVGEAGPIDFRTQFAESLLNYLNRFTEIFIFNFSPTNVFVGGMLALVVLYIIRRERLLLFFLFSNLPIFIFGGHTNTYANVGLVVPAILALTLLLRNIWKIDKRFVYLIICLSLISNLVTIFKINPEGQIILVIPNDMNLKNELKLIDETYRIAAGEKFSINTLTLPLWTNTTWAYLYDWYGKSKYGYVPQFLGHDQIGLLGVDSLQKIDKPFNRTFLIIEPPEGIPPRFYSEELDTENSRSKLTKEINYGSIKLQVRTPIENE